VDVAHQEFLLWMRSVGNLILEDDIADLYRFSFPGHPSPFHHWQLGLGIKALADLVLLKNALDEFPAALERDRERAIVRVAPPQDVFGIDELRRKFDEITRSLQ
jgi:hypothetical protein